jgi:predicted RNase H-like HicB family nuclease
MRFPTLKVNAMPQRLTMVYWHGDRMWLGKLLEYPEIMTQGETIEELEENLKDAFRMMFLDDVPAEHLTKEIAV